ncbi:MAG: carboxymuconolactone decarboxylase family protein [Bacillota bacterium]
MSRVAEFERFRERMNELILGAGNRTVDRFFALDSRAYDEGRLDEKTKEMLGLVSSMVLRCDDCITYHLLQCHGLGVDLSEFFEIFAIALVVGGSITIPHIRRAVEVLEELGEISDGDR